MGKEEISAVTSILRNGALTSSANQGGKHVQAFEKSVTSFVKSKYAVAVNSGTAALQAALYALDIKKGDEVLVPSFTFVATANAIVSTGAKPVFVDILKENYTIDTDDIQKKITKKTRAIIPVHLYGNVANIEYVQINLVTCISFFKMAWFHNAFAKFRNIKIHAYLTRFID